MLLLPLSVGLKAASGEKIACFMLLSAWLLPIKYRIGYDAAAFC
jgi:hypothetical protein